MSQAPLVKLNVFPIIKCSDALLLHGGIANVTYLYVGNVIITLPTLHHLLEINPSFVSV